MNAKVEKESEQASPQPSKMRERRNELKELSAPLKELVAEGVHPTINDALITEVYKVRGQELKTLRQWNKDGYRVKKGEKALMLWSKPVEKLKDPEATEAPEDENEPKLFGIALMFTEKQVQPFKN